MSSIASGYVHYKNLKHLYFLQYYYIQYDILSVFQNRNWRKSRNDNPGSNCTGTDLNRNYNASHWGSKYWFFLRHWEFSKQNTQVSPGKIRKHNNIVWNVINISYGDH